MQLSTKVMRHGKRQEKIQDTKQSAEPDSDMTQVLEIPEKAFNITMMNTLQAPVGKADSV